MNNKLNYHNLVFFDLITTGLGFNCEIIQIGAIDATTGDEFEACIDFDIEKADEKAIIDGGYDEDKWNAKAVPLGQALDRFNVFLKCHATLDRVGKSGKEYKVAALGGFNVYSFDKLILEKAYKGQNMFFPGDYRMFDVYSLAIWRFPNLSSYTLESICSHIGYEIDGIGALAKAKASMEIAKHIMAKSFKFQRIDWR